MKNKFKKMGLPETFLITVIKYVLNNTSNVSNISNISNESFLVPLRNNSIVKCKNNLCYYYEVIE